MIDLSKIRELDTPIRQGGEWPAMIYNKIEETAFNWIDLHKKVVRIVVAEPNPECFEPLGQVWAQDLESGKIYLIAEYKAGKGEK